MKTNLRKFVVESLVIEQGVRQNVEVWYIREIIKRWIIADTTVQVHWSTYQLGWLVGQQTGVVSLLLNVSIGN